YLETYKLLEEGLNAEQIGEKRDLKASTIESHFVRGIRDRKVALDKVMSETDIAVILPAVENNKDAALTGVYSDLKGKYTFGQLRMVLSHVLNKKE
ncbi:MAG: helix-turn-helix domain-containing protein, partial [Flavobacteriales bacterium]|nr:helix-turn-helix domain-containing protein [Flavobacteriales bacterium]